MKSMPKIELHQHLDCSLRLSTVYEIATELKLDLPLNNKDAFRKAVLIEEPMTDLKTVLSKFLVAQKVLHSRDVLERMAIEAVEDVFNSGVRLVEFRYSPSFIQSGHEDLTYQEIHDSILSGIEKAKAKYEIGVGLIGIIGRIDPIEKATEVCDFIISNKDTFVGIDLADSEIGFDCKKFSALFQKAKSKGLHITVHAGEPDYPEAVQSVKDAIEQLGAERIGHGIQVHKSPQMMEYLAKNKIPLEICPTSNYLTNSVNSIAEHPIRKIMSAGVRVTVNTDDPGIFNYDLTHEYEALERELKFTKNEFDKMNQWAFESTFLTDSEKKFWPNSKS
ncbi:MAG: adenosine deaminase [Bdellovibrionales bacterium]|nr:adenosine deaminase [Bdellovibrionales bacterium]